VEWLAFTVGAITGAFGIVVPVLVAWRQRVIQIRDRTAERELERERQLEREEHQAKIARREKWQPEYQEIRQCLDCGDKLAYSVLDNGPCAIGELEALDVATFIINSKILAERGIELLRDPLLMLAERADDLRRHAVRDIPEEVAADATDVPYRLPDGIKYRSLLREAILQDRAARCLATEIKAARRILLEEWGD
jgi:hypothetical protein